jgi:hypothetical protein
VNTFTSLSTATGRSQTSVEPNPRPTPNCRSAAPPSIRPRARTRAQIHDAQIVRVAAHRTRTEPVGNARRTGDLALRRPWSDDEAATLRGRRRARIRCRGAQGAWSERCPFRTQRTDTPQSAWSMWGAGWGRTIPADWAGRRRGRAHEACARHPDRLDRGRSAALPRPRGLEPRTPVSRCSRGSEWP